MNLQNYIATMPTYIFAAWVIMLVTVSAALASATVIASTPARHPDLILVTMEELEKTKLVLDFAERNCKKLGFRVEGSGAYISVTCGSR